MAADIEDLTRQIFCGITTIICGMGDSTMAQRLEKRGHVTEQWNLKDCDLSTKSGFLYAKKRLVQARPRNLWITPPQITVANKRRCPERGTMKRRTYTENERKRAQRDKLIWGHSARLCFLQAELGGNFYIDSSEQDER